MVNRSVIGLCVAGSLAGLAPLGAAQCAPGWDTAPAAPLGISLSPRGAVVHDGAFHIAGPYTSPTGVDNVVARWDGSGWESLGSFPIGARVNALGSFGGQLYVGGGFTAIGGVTVNNIARWNGSSWEAVGGGIPGVQLSRMRTLTFQGETKLYVGVFNGGVRAWDGTNWETVGSNLTGSVNDMIVWDDGTGEKLFACGQNLSIDGRDAQGIAEFDGDVWSVLGDGQSLEGGFGRGAAMAIYDDGAGEQLYVGGDFITAGGIDSFNIARWSGNDWSAVGAGFDANVIDVLVADVGNGPKLYAGGGFFFSGSTQVDLLAVLDPAEGWDRLGMGLGGGVVPSVSRLGFIRDADGAWLYAAGAFTDVEFTSAPTVARWGCADVGCYADCDESGGLDFFDFLCFQNEFAAGASYADCDGSGGLDFFDFLCFQNEFAAGCP